MSIAARLAAITPVTQCGFGRQLAAMSAEDRVLVEESLTSGKVTPYQLEGLLRDEGIPATREVIKRHLSGACLCQSKTA